MRRNEPCKNCTEYWAPSQVYRETEGERLHDPDVQHDHPDGILCATSMPRPRPGVGGRGDRRADVWLVGRCDRGMLPRGRPPVVRVVPGCAAATCVLLVRWTRFAPPAASKPSAIVEGRSSIVRGMERLSALRSCTLVSGPLPRLVPRRRRVDGPCPPRAVPTAANGAQSWVPDSFRLRRVVLAMMRIIKQHTFAPAHIHIVY